MKETNKMSRAVCQLEKMYNTINTDLFNGELPIPIITVQSSKGSWGHSSRSKIWKRKQDDAYELNISAECINECIEEIVDTLIHEAIHLYCREKGIKEVSRGGIYHNKEFKKLAEEKLLKCYYNEKIGYNTTPVGNDRLFDYILSKDWSEIKIGRGEKTISLPTGISIINIDTGEVKISTSSTRKYQCPKCLNSCRATKDINIICGDCNIKMEKVVK